jgi:hypothetical protein
VAADWRQIEITPGPPLRVRRRAKGIDMQDTAHLIVNSQKILVLRRANFAACDVSLKIRKSGKDGMFLQDESIYLEGEPDVLKELQDGKVIRI